MRTKYWTALVAGGMASTVDEVLRHKIARETIKKHFRPLLNCDRDVIRRVIGFEPQATKTTKI